MDAHATHIFEEIIETLSLTVIHYAAEDALKGVCDAEDRALFEQILGLNSLDEIWIVCHNRAAKWHLKKVSDIQQFLDKKRGQQ